MIDPLPSSSGLARGRDRSQDRVQPFELPSRYGQDVARLALVDPEKIHAWWEVSESTLARAAGRQGTLAVRLLRVDGGEKTVHSAGVLAVQSWYWEVEPLARYRAEVGWQLPDGRFETWLASNELATPRLAPNITERVRWRVRGERVVSEEERHDSLEPRAASAPERAGASAGLARRRGEGRVSWRAAAWSRTLQRPGAVE